MATNRPKSNPVIAMYNLAQSYEKGRGTPINLLKAVEMYGKCFDQLGMAAKGDVIDKLKKLIGENSDDKKFKKTASDLLEKITPTQKRGWSPFSRS